MNLDTLRTTMRTRLLALAELPREPTSWYEIKAQQEDTAVIRIYDTIAPFGVTADDFVRELADLTASEVEVQINSRGGDAFDGLAIYNALRAHPARVTTRVDGVAASAASVIAQAGDHRVMMSSAQMMIHEAWGIAIGPAAEMRAFADLLDQQNEIMARLYAARAGGDVDHFRGLMATETWLTDEKAVELGLADEVFEPARKETAPAPAEEPDALAAAVRAELNRLGISLGRDVAPAPDPAPDLDVDPDVAEDLDQDAARTMLAALDLQ